MGTDGAQRVGGVAACLGLHRNDPDSCLGCPCYRLLSLFVALEVVGHERRIEEAVRIVHKGVEHLWLVLVRGHPEETHLALFSQFDEGLPRLRNEYPLLVGEIMELDDIHIVGLQRPRGLSRHP